MIAHILPKSIKNLYRFRKIKKSYPYEFGGIQRGNYSLGCQNLLKGIFGSNVFNDMTNVYLNVLNALEKKELKILNKILQRNLTKCLALQNVNLKYKEEIKAYCSDNFLLIDGTFQRNPNVRYFKFSNQQDNDLKIYMSSGYGIQQNTPILFGTKVYFEGKTKLQQENSIFSSEIETHMVQFQIQTTISFQQFIDLGNSEISNRQDKNMIKFLIGKGYEWKIGDMDHKLNGNINFD